MKPELLGTLQLELFIASAPVEPVRPTHGRVARHEPKGAVYDLERFFRAINQAAFRNELKYPTLRWSRNRWQRVLGLCDVKKEVITLNRALDDARVPDLVVADVLHHEMLHLYFGISEGSDGRKRIHPPQFRAAEKQFPAHATSEKWIEEHWPLRGRPATRTRGEETSFLNYLSLMTGAPAAITGNGAAAGG